MLKLEEYDVFPLLHAAPVSSVTISPDGEWILFVRSTVNVDEDRYESHIWIVSSAGGEPRQFTYSAGSDSNPLWSIDGKKIYFLSNRSTGAKDEKKKNRLWVISASGGEARLIAEAKYGISSPVLSPDGKHVLFSSRIEEDEEARPEDDESDVLWITKLKYKLNGQPFFPYTRSHLFTVSTDGGIPVQLTKGKYDISTADWSPDANHIAFVTNTEDCDHSLIKDIYVMPMTGGEAKKITDGTIMTRSVSWSPDGSWIAYTGYEPFGPNYTGWRNTDIWVVPKSGGDKQNVSSSFDRSISSRGGGLVWSKDSTRINFTAPDQGATHIYMVDINSQKISQITDGNIRVSAFTKTGERIAYAANETLWPHEVFIHDGEASKRLTTLNKDIMKEMPLSEPEEYWFTASDGERIHGWIMKPIGYEKGCKYPAILQVHGGPMGSYGYSLSHQFQVLARHGYAVIYCNPRMSTGYGEKIAAECSGHYGEKDYSDVIECVEYVVANYSIVDPSRLGVAGGSYGGWMTNWVVGHTNIFSAAVTSRSISNWDSFYGTSDIGWTWVPWQVNFGKEPWESWDLVREKSPITYVDKIETPLLIIHSEQDWRCPIPDGEQLFIALKKMKKDVEFIRFPNENHGLAGRGKPKHRIERLRHMVRWFNKYLK